MLFLDINIIISWLLAINYLITLTILLSYMFLTSFFYQAEYSQRFSEYTNIAWRATSNWLLCHLTPCDVTSRHAIFA